MLTEAHACVDTGPVLALHQELQEERRVLRAEVAAGQAEQEQMRLQVRFTSKQGPASCLRVKPLSWLHDGVLPSASRTYETDARVKRRVCSGFDLCLAGVSREGTDGVMIGPYCGRQS